MPTKDNHGLFTNWDYYLRFLWSIAALFTVYIIYTYTEVSKDTAINPAVGLAMVGVFYYTVILLAFLGFIAFNHFIRRKLAKNVKVSNRFLMASWLSIAILCTGAVVTSFIGILSQSHYEKHVAPKLERCHQEYLDGKRSTPYENCTDGESLHSMLQ